MSIEAVELTSSTDSVFTVSFLMSLMTKVTFLEAFGLTCAWITYSFNGLSFVDDGMRVENSNRDSQAV